MPENDNASVLVFRQSTLTVILSTWLLSVAFCTIVGIYIGEYVVREKERQLRLVLCSVLDGRTKAYNMICNYNYDK